MNDRLKFSRRNPVEANDLPDMRARWARYRPLCLEGEGRGAGEFTDRKDKAFFIPKSEIAGNKYDLSLNRYKEIVHEEVQYDPPKEILARLKKLESDIASDLEEREAMRG